MEIQCHIFKVQLLSNADMWCVKNSLLGQAESCIKLFVFFQPLSRRLWLHLTTCTNYAPFCSQSGDFFFSFFKVFNLLINKSFKCISAPPTLLILFRPHPLLTGVWNEATWPFNRHRQILRPAECQILPLPQVILLWCICSGLGLFILVKGNVTTYKDILDNYACSSPRKALPCTSMTLHAVWAP